MPIVSQMNDEFVPIPSSMAYTMYQHKNRTSHIDGIGRNFPFPWRYSCLPWFWWWWSMVEWSFFLLYCHESKNYAWCHCWWIDFGKFHAKLFLLLNFFFFHCWHVFHPITSSLVRCWILECAPSPALYFYFSTSQLSPTDPSNSLPFLVVWCCCFLPWFQMSIAYSWRL